jgi:hypothetical protein
MDYATFKASLSHDQPPPNLSSALHALWWDAKGNWERAHACVQTQDDAASAWVHAYLHRKEGDLFNASYWYRRAGKPAFAGAFADEWEALVRALL